MIKSIMTSLVFLFSANFSQAAPLCSSDLLTTPDSYASALSICRSEIKKQDRNFLSSWIDEKESHCRLFYPSIFSEGYKDCLSDILKLTNEVLTCTSNAQRQDEAVAYDRKLLTDLIQDNGGEAEISEAVQKSFADLVKSTELKYNFRFSPSWSLSAYQSSVLNAHAGAGGEIVISAAFWKGPIEFTKDEISAILAHEIAHVLKGHSLSLGCLALEWVGSGFTIEEVSKIFREDFSSASVRGQVWSEKSQSYEVEADKVATSILATAGIDPRSMARALEKLKPKDSGGFSSGSHPTFDFRIRNALEGL